MQALGPGRQEDPDGAEPTDGYGGRKAARIVSAREVRGNIYELLLACLPADFILKELMLRLVAEVKNDALKQKVFLSGL